MQGEAPSGFSLDQSDAFTVNLCKNTITKMKIFGDTLKVSTTPLHFEYGNLYFKVTFFRNRVLFFLTLNNRDQLREPDLFIDRNSKRKNRRGGGGERPEERKGVIKY